MSNEISLEQWCKLSDEEKRTRYKDLNYRDGYLARVGAGTGGVGTISIPEEKLTTEQRKEWEEEKAWIKNWIETSNKREGSNGER